MTSPVWDPRQYLRHAGPRLRPAVELLARVDLDEPARVVDLGCGPGTSTSLLRARWPRASIIGIDDSPEMLAVAAAADVRAEWVRADIAALPIGRRFDLVFSNAALHWVRDHEALFARLLGLLNPGGVLAVQMPTNHHAPSHRLVAEMASEPRWIGRLGSLDLSTPVRTAADYVAMVRSSVDALDVWETEYQHELMGPTPVLDWIRGTSLRPVLSSLSPEAGERFCADLVPLLAQAYPPDDAGRTRFPFRRLFLVAVR